MKRKLGCLSAVSVTVVLDEFNCEVLRERRNSYREPVSATTLVPFQPTTGPYDNDLEAPLSHSFRPDPEHHPSPFAPRKLNIDQV